MKKLSFIAFLALLSSACTQNTSIVWYEGETMENGTARSGHKGCRFIGCDIYSGALYRTNFWTGSPAIAAELCKEGYKVLVYDVTHYYMDMTYTSSREEAGDNIGRT